MGMGGKRMQLTQAKHFGWLFKHFTDRFCIVNAGNGFTH